MKPSYQLNIALQSPMSPLGEEVGFLEVFADNRLYS